MLDGDIKLYHLNVLLNTQLGNTAAAQNGFEIVIDKANKLILSP